MVPGAIGSPRLGRHPRARTASAKLGFAPLAWASRCAASVASAGRRLIVARFRWKCREARGRTGAARGRGSDCRPGPRRAARPTGHASKPHRHRRRRLPPRAPGHGPLRNAGARRQGATPDADPPRPTEGRSRRRARMLRMPPRRGRGATSIGRGAPPLPRSSLPKRSAPAQPGPPFPSTPPARRARVSRRSASGRARTHRPRCRHARPARARRRGRSRRSPHGTTTRGGARRAAARSPRQAAAARRRAHRGPPR